MCRARTRACGTQAQAECRGPLCSMLEGETVRVRASAGLAALQATQNERAVEVLARADEALYRATRAGRNQLAITGPDDGLPAAKTG